MLQPRSVWHQFCQSVVESFFFSVFKIRCMSKVNPFNPNNNVCLRFRVHSPGIRAVPVDSVSVSYGFSGWFFTQHRHPH